MPSSRRSDSVAFSSGARPRRRIVGAVLAAAVAASLAGCSGEKAGETVTVTADSLPSSSSPAPQTGSGMGAQTPSGSETSAAPSPTALPVVGTRKGSDDQGIPVEVTLNSVVADGKVMTVTWSARNAGDQDWQPTDYFFTGSYFDGPKFQGDHPDMAKSQNSFDADGVYVVDRASARRYLTGRDTSGRCACSSTASAILAPGGEMVLTALYQAPGPEVTTVDVVIPNAGTFADVPVSR